MIVYFDTSALLKLLVDEDGSDDAAELWDAADLVLVSRLAYPEVRAALAAAARAKRLTPAAHRRAKSELDRTWRQVAVVDLSAGICEDAGDLAERHALRGYDAVQLASAVAASSGDLVLATLDRDLASAAISEGIAVSGSASSPWRDPVQPDAHLKSSAAGSTRNGSTTRRPSRSASC